jgi:hypothetical protein
MQNNDGSFQNPLHPACNTCKHYIPGTLSCKAFQRIPEEILMCENDHKLPVRGDHGIRWEAE